MISVARGSALEASRLTLTAAVVGAQYLTPSHTYTPSPSSPATYSLAMASVLFARHASLRTAGRLAALRSSVAAAAAAAANGARLASAEAASQGKVARASASSVRVRETASREASRRSKLYELLPSASRGAKQPDERACYRCGLRGHLAAACPQGRTSASGAAAARERRGPVIPLSSDVGAVSEPGADGSGSVVQYNRRMTAALSSDAASVPKMFDEMHLHSVEPNVVSFNTLLSAHRRLGEVDRVLAVLRAMRDCRLEPDVISYTTAMACAFECDRSELGMQLYREMREAGIAPSPLTYSVLISDRAHQRDFATAERLLGELRGAVDAESAAAAAARGAASEATSDAPGSAVRPSSFGRFSPSQYLQAELSKLAGVFAGMAWGAPVDEITRFLQRAERSLGAPADERVYSDVIAALARRGDRAAARHFFNVLRSHGTLRPTVYSYNNMISALLAPPASSGAAAAGTAAAAAHATDELAPLVRDMRADGIAPNARTIELLVNAFLARRDLASAVRLVREVAASGETPPDVATLNVLLQAIVAEETARARRSADATAAATAAPAPAPEAPAPAPLAWTSAELLQHMRAQALQPSARTFAILLSGAADVGSLARLDEITAAMREAGVAPTRFTFNLSLKTAFRAGDRARADAVLASMAAAGVAPDVATFTLLLHNDALPAGVSATGFIDYITERGVQPDGKAYASVVSVLARKGDARAALAALDRCRAEGHVLTAAAAGLVRPLVEADAASEHVAARRAALAAAEAAASAARRGAPRSRPIAQRGPRNRSTSASALA